MTPELEQQAKDACEHCRKGSLLRFRSNTREWVHDYWNGSAFMHTICRADALRKENAE